MEKQPTSSALIRFPDCDPLGHLNNGKYIDYMINAREDHLRAYYELNIYDYLKTHGTSWVVGKNEIIYKSPANLMEEVMIRSQVLGFGPRKIQVEVAMFDATMTRLKAVLWSVFLPFDLKTQRVGYHSEDLMTLLSQVLLPVNSENIEDRVNKIGLKARPQLAG